MKTITPFQVMLIRSLSWTFGTGGVPTTSKFDFIRFNVDFCISVFPCSADLRSFAVNYGGVLGFPCSADSGSFDVNYGGKAH